MVINMLGEGTMLRSDQSKVDIDLKDSQWGDNNTYTEGCSDSALALQLREAQMEIEHLKERINDKNDLIKELRASNAFLMAQANK